MRRVSNSTTTTIQAVYIVQANPAGSFMGWRTDGREKVSGMNGKRRVYSLIDVATVGGYYAVCLCFFLWLQRSSLTLST